MQLSDQPLSEFAILALTGIVWSATMALLVTDYRGALTRYTHRCWLLHQVADNDVLHCAARPARSASVRGWQWEHDLARGLRSRPR